MGRYDKTCANPSCGATIPAINLEFGGPHMYTDAVATALVCSRKCYGEYHQSVQDEMTRAYAPGGHLSNSEECRKYIFGEREAS